MGRIDFHTLVRDRSLRLAVGLAVAVAIPVAILFYFQFRSIAALGNSSRVVLQQLSQETADGVTKTLQDALRAPRTDVLLKIGQRQTEPLDLDMIQSTFDAGFMADPFVDTFYVWSEATNEHRGDVIAYGRETRELVINPPESAFIVKEFRELSGAKRAIAVFDAPLNGRRTYFLAQLRFTFPSRERMTSFVALRVDAERLRQEFIPQLVASKFAKVEGPTGFPPLVVTVLDGDNRVIFPTDGSGSARDGFVHERTFPLVFYEPDLTLFQAPVDKPLEIWRVRTGYGNQTIPQIVASRERPQRALMAMLAGVMALGVFFVARAAAREVRLAELKSSFVSSVSHDLKTPLALIQLFAETLELGRMKNTDRAPEYYRIINSEARKLTRLINNLLDFSKIEAGLRAVQARTQRPDRGHAPRAGLARESVPAQSVHRDVQARRAGSGVDRPGGGRTGPGEPAVERDEVFSRAPRNRRRGRAGRTARRGARHRPRCWHPNALPAPHFPEVLSHSD